MFSKDFFKSTKAKEKVVLPLKGTSAYLDLFSSGLQIKLKDAKEAKPTNMP
jgi:hypothetical protein